ncbi:MAG TPA: cyanoexosortase C [Leptolyngbyaceae cyanobacterium M33_DOE_097]|uniref:Cyanoexosortase C n=1 Tax=Oscillatoriales cyanobacterium SpSt-418 TaxID=2282169 RepID=A0A7C3KFJ8_9CYAN|nr:cyanoexosortase C [Leptolyngbyaceae cyanobacterium M33_DOE_097]
MAILNSGKHQKIKNLLIKYLSTYHGRFLALGLIAALIYLPTYLFILWRTTFIDGKSTVILNLGFLHLGITQLWQHRSQLSQQRPHEDERFVGHFLISCGALSLPFCLESASLQAFVVMLVLGGVLYSSFGMQVFKNFPLSCGMLFASVYPDWAFLSNYIFHFLTGPNFLENIMAVVGKHALTLIGQPAIAEGPYINLPTGSVLIGSGCTGFDMAFSIAGFSFLMGIWMKQPWTRIAIGMFFGIVLAFILNIPRIMLLTFAVVYWGKDAFEFWHGGWGGQIFAGVLFTVYYYILMPIYKSDFSLSKSKEVK